MAKISYFIADLHLTETREDLTAFFVTFMHERAPQADALYILGDLFDFWIGDDERSPLIETVQRCIRAVTDAGVPCYFVHGNRDFMLGKQFAQACGLQLLGDYTVVDLYGEPTLICHGDTLCIDDVKYQTFRRKVHQKWRQWLFLHLPLKLRQKIARRIRAKSRRDKQGKPEDIMDVNPAFVRETVARFGVKRLIHGHTHRQAVHREPDYIRIVLGDWGPTPSILAVSPQNVEFIA